MRKIRKFYATNTHYEYAHGLNEPSDETSGQFYKGFTMLNYDTRVISDFKIPHITNLEPLFTIVKPLCAYHSIRHLKDLEPNHETWLKQRPFDGTSYSTIFMGKQRQF